MGISKQLKLPFEVLLLQFQSCIRKSRAPRLVCPATSFGFMLDICCTGGRGSLKNTVWHFITAMEACYSIDTSLQRLTRTQEACAFAISSKCKAYIVATFAAGSLAKLEPWRCEVCSVLLSSMCRASRPHLRICMQRQSGRFRVGVGAPTHLYHLVKCCCCTWGSFSCDARYESSVHCCSTQRNAAVIHKFWQINIVSGAGCKERYSTV